MVGTDTYLVLGANHTVGLNATDLGSLDRKAFITVVQFRAVHGYDHFLSGSHVRGATYDL